MNTMTWLRSLSIRTKAVASSMILVGCLIGLGSQAYYAMGKSIAGFKALAAISIPEQQAVSELSNSLIATHVMILRFVSWSSNGVDKALLDPLTADILKNLEELSISFSTLGARSDFVDLGQAQLSHVTANWLRYYRAAKNTIDIGTADAPLATMTLGETDEKYRDLVADLGRFSKEVASSVKSTAEARANETEIGQWILAIGGGAGVLISIIASVFISGSITKPIHAVTRAMEQLSSGDTTVTLGYSDRQDEIGTMVRAIGVFRQTQLNMRELELDNRRQTQQRMAERKAEMAQLADRFEAAIVNVVQAVSSSAGQLELAAATLKDTAEETKRSSADVVTASQNAYGNVEGLASAVDELSKSVHEISHQAAESTDTVNKAVQQASFADSRMTELSSAASRIEHVVQLITAIAAQTNLLALNATIEASRAGAAGKGFAVVAAEVKNLASQTAHATGEIGAQVAAMQIATGESVAAIKGVGNTIKHVAESASVIFSAVDRQRSAAEEISNTVRTAADCTRDAATRMSDVSQGAIETGSAATQVLEAARLLSEKGTHLRAEVDRFLANVRAA